MAPRKRAPGGGRRPAGPIHGKSEAFSTRITPQTREALLAEKKQTGKSVSQIAEEMMELGLVTKRDSERDDPMRDFAFLIEYLAILIASPHDDNDRRWRTDPFLFRSLQAAIHELMNRLAPEGEVIAPSDLKGPPASKSTPKRRAAWAVDAAWSLFVYTLAPTIGIDWTKPSPVPARVRAETEAFLANFVRARKTLMPGNL
jgi:hypothetical protein